MKWFFTFAIHFISFFSQSQVYHYVTKQILPDPSPYKFYQKQGTFKTYSADYYTFLIPYKDGNYLQLPLIHIKSIAAGNTYPVFLFQGGPGISNLSWDKYFPYFLTDSFDIYLLGYKGIDGFPVLKQTQFSVLASSSENILDNRNLWIFAQQFRDSIDKIFGENFFSIQRYCYDLLQIIDALNMDKINFCCFSYGGFIAQYFSQFYPDHVAAMILSGCRPIDQINPQLDVSVIEQMAINKNIRFNNLKLNDIQSIALIHLFYDNEILYQFGSINNVPARYVFLNRLFARNYTNNPYFADFFIKLHCSASFNLQITDNDFLTSSAYVFNNWIKLGCNKNLEVPSLQKSNIKTAWICSENDIISPPELFVHIQDIFPNSKQFIIDATAHSEMANFEKFKTIIIDYYIK